MAFIFCGSSLGVTNEVDYFSIIVLAYYGLECMLGKVGSCTFSSSKVVFSRVSAIFFNFLGVFFLRIASLSVSNSSNSFSESYFIW